MFPTLAIDDFIDQRCDHTVANKYAVIHFDQAYLIGLPRMGRLAEFHADFPADFPTPKPLHFHAYDAKVIPIPDWWGDEIPSLYCCGESHRAVIADALSRGYESIAIFEDDARFIPNAGRIAWEFLSQVPNDWMAVMWGGQVSVHDGKTELVSPRVSRCVQVERLHAYGLSRKGMEVFYAALSEPNRVANDYRFGDLQEQGRLITYRCEPFIAYQGAGRSAISGRIEANRIWDDRVDVRLRDPANIPIIALVCPFAVMERLRDAGIIANGGESPPFMAPDVVEESERRVADRMLAAFEENTTAAYAACAQLLNDTAFHQDAIFALWHPRRPIPHARATVIRADTYESAIQQLGAANNVVVSH